MGVAIVSKPKAIRVEHLADVPLDMPGMFIRCERRHWDDGTSCLHAAKWATQPNRGHPAPWMPQQYIQIPWPQAPEFVRTLLLALAKANAFQGAVSEQLLALAQNTISDRGGRS